jgi:hypothetical protein
LWAQQTVDAIEKGRRALTIGELWLMPEVLNVRITELVATDEPTDLEGVVVSPDVLASLVAGRPTRLLARHDRIGGQTVSPPLIQQPGQVFASPTISASEDRTLARYQLEPDAFEMAAIRSAAWDDATKKVARSLTEKLRRKIDPFEVACASWSLWKRGLREQRDALTGEQTDSSAIEDEGGQRAMQARRGHVTRKLTDELRERIKQARGRAK